MAVYTGMPGDHPKPATLGPSLLDPSGHRPRGGGATGQGVAVPPTTPPSRPPLSVTAIGVAVHRHKGGSALGVATQA